MRAPLFRLLLLLTFLAAPAHAEDLDLETRWKQVRTKAVKQLHGLADWCTSAKLFGARADVYDGILRIEPDDATARKRLKFKRAKDGTWTRPARWKKPKNLSKGIDEFRERQAALGVTFRDAVAELFEIADDESNYRVRAQLVATALAVAPDNTDFRGWNRETRSGDDWILKESLIARTRRTELTEAAAKAFDAQPKPKAGEPQPQDRHGSVGWSDVLEGTRARICGTTGTEELAHILRAVETCWPVLRNALGEAAPLFRSTGRYGGAGFTVYAFEDVLAANEFFAAQPTTTARDAEFCAPLVGAWIPKRNANVVKSPAPATRLEAASKGAMGALIRFVTRLDKRRAWAAEGLTLYLNHQVVGTRTIYTVNDEQSAYAEPNKPIPEYQRRMADPNADWLSLGLSMLRSTEKPDMHLMSGKDYNNITRAEMLYGYCVAAYVCEGWPKRAAEFYKTLAGPTGTDVDKLCLEVFQLEARTFEARLIRWLDETTR